MYVSAGIRTSDPSLSGATLTVVVELGFHAWHFDMNMGGTVSFCIGVPSIPSSNKTRSFRGNSAENTE